jgi:hypothetical protein
VVLKKNLITCQEGKKVEGARAVENGAPFRNQCSALRKEFVLFNDRGHGHFALAGSVLDPHYAPFALHADAFRQRDLGREGQSEADGRTTFDGRIEVKTNAARAYVADLS